MPPVAVIVTAPLLCPLHATLVISAVAPKSLPALFTTKLISAVQPFASTNSAVYKPDAKPVKVTCPPAPTASVVPSTVISPAVSEPIVTSPSLAPQSCSHSHPLPSPHSCPHPTCSDLLHYPHLTMRKCTAPCRPLP